MYRFCLVFSPALICVAALGAGSPPSFEPRTSPKNTDTGIFVLPGAPSEPSRPAALLLPPPPVESLRPAPPLPAPAPVAQARLVARRLRTPVDLTNDSGVYLQQNLGIWKREDARMLLGLPLRDRISYDDGKAVDGHIYTFADPTGRYKQLELDFEKETGLLRTVFLYPWRMTWDECRRTWGGTVNTADAAHGRKFYSYTNRHLDVLVYAAGNVISLGLY
jgi:hypothetical protein